MQDERVPRASSCCFFPEPGGRPRRFGAGGSDEYPEAEPPPAGETSARDMLPSGPYFLGLPRFFFTGSLMLMVNPPPPGRISSGGSPAWLESAGGPPAAVGLKDRRTPGIVAAGEGLPGRPPATKLGWCSEELILGSALASIHEPRVCDRDDREKTELGFLDPQRRWMKRGGRLEGKPRASRVSKNGVEEGTERVVLQRRSEPSPKRGETKSKWKAQEQGDGADLGGGDGVPCRRERSGGETTA